MSEPAVIPTKKVRFTIDEEPIDKLKPVRTRIPRRIPSRKTTMTYFPFRSKKDESVIDYYLEFHVVWGGYFERRIKLSSGDVKCAKRIVKEICSFHGYGSEVTEKAHREVNNHLNEILPMEAFIAIVKFTQPV